MKCFVAEKYMFTLVKYEKKQDIFFSNLLLDTILWSLTSFCPSLAEIQDSLRKSL